VPVKNKAVNTIYYLETIHSNGVQNREILDYALPLNHILKLVKRATTRKTFVLLSGKSGTDNELVAHTIHI
jgi:transcriptional regulator with PAS, ATPase and Fis domain